MIINYFNLLKYKVINFVNTTGRAILFLIRTIITLFTTKLKFKQVILQIETIGVGSLIVILLAGTSAGLALALQTYIGLSRFKGEDFIGVVVSLGMVRELAPVLTGLMVMGKSGSAITAELGSMKITEQIDALKTLCINPFRYLIVPRILATAIILPLLTAIFMLCGIGGSYYFVTQILGINSESYLTKVRSVIELKDIIGSLFKASVFGLIISWIGTFFGYNTQGGARGVGISTTQSVVVGSTLILLFNYILSSLLFALYFES